MGQAKLRGTKAERVKEGIEKARVRHLEFEKRRAERWQNMTADERMTTMLLATFMQRHGL
jgi:hypothetical protein